jgi:hypothetical protein
LLSFLLAVTAKTNDTHTALMTSRFIQPLPGTQSVKRICFITAYSTTAIRVGFIAAI